MKWLLFLLLPLVVWCMLLRCGRYHPAWKTLRQFRYAHRGLHDKPAIPENSMAAFRRAVEHGFGAELDVHLMKDGNLAVIHDSSLLRTAGVELHVEDLTKEDLQRYSLEESTEKIPLLQEVLALFAGKAPLIIELKPERGNRNELCAAVAAMLDPYTGDYCVESFDPRVVRWFRRHRPEVCRGQLSYNFLHDEKSRLPKLLKFILTNLFYNASNQPDFVAYRFADRRNLSFRLCRFLWRPVIVHWTIQTPEELRTAEQEGAVCIFEHFIP